jgi:glycosyltransferase involved in cell wall biosynthesis
VALFPIVDFLVFKIISRTVPVVFTVHDTTPFNGSATARLQAIGFTCLLKEANFLIVHTNSGKKDLIKMTGTPDRVARIHHGPLHLAVGSQDRAHERGRDSRWTLLLFGKLQTYKGLDVLVEALGFLSETERERLRVIVAGEPIMAIQPILDRADTLGVRNLLEFRLFRHTEPEMHALFESCDALVFPYRMIEASGVLFLTLPYGKWIIASRLGAFTECIEEGISGSLVEPGSPGALAEAIIRTIGSTPTGSPKVPTWDAIASETLHIYERLIAIRKVTGRRNE